MDATISLKQLAILLIVIAVIVLLILGVSLIGEGLQRGEN